MKKLIIACLAFFMISCHSATSDKRTQKEEDTMPKQELAIEKESKRSTEEIISDIREKFKEINDKAQVYSKVERNLEGESAEGGVLKAYFKDKDLKKIIVTYYGETGKKVMEYYFDKDRLFFVFEQVHRYNAPMYVDKEMAQKEGVEYYFDPEKTKIIEGRYYFENEILVRWLDDNKTEIDLSIASNSQVGQELVTQSKKMKGMIK